MGEPVEHEIEEGAIVFGQDGRKAEYVTRLKMGHLVRPMFETGDYVGGPNESEPVMAVSDSLAIFREVYLVAPTAIYDETVAEIREDIAQHRAELAALVEEIRDTRAEILSAGRERRELLAGLKNHIALQHIDDFLAGRLTHFVICDSQGIRVETSEEAIKGRDERKLRLLCLYGGSEGNLQWAINRWSDGSGHDTEVYPFTSEFRAVEFAKNLIAERINEAVDAGRIFSLRQLIEAADKLGCEVIAAIRETSTKEREAYARRQVDEAAKALERAERALAEVAAG